VTNQIFHGFIQMQPHYGLKSDQWITLHIYGSMVQHSLSGCAGSSPPIVIKGNATQNHGSNTGG
jgi:hypothetical protein